MKKGSKINYALAVKIMRLRRTTALSLHQIGAQVGVGQAAVSRVLRNGVEHYREDCVQARESRRTSQVSNKHGEPPYMPTPAEIAAACAQIRAGHLAECGAVLAVDEDDAFDDWELS